MERLTTIMLLVFIMIKSHAQLHLDDPNYIYQTTSGEVLHKEEVNRRLTSRQHYTLKEKAKEDGTFLVTLVPITNKEFRQIIKEKKKLVKAMVGVKVPNYKLLNVNGEEITNHSFDKAKVTVYNFWFTTCPHCIEEIPKLNLIVEDFDRVNFIAPTFNTQTQVAKFLETNAFNYTILTNGKRLARDMHIRSYPTHFIVDHDGIIRHVIVGSSNHVIRKLRRSIYDLLYKQN